MSSAKEIISIFFIAIVLYLLVANASGSASVINAIGTQITSATATLQGRGSGGSTGAASVPLAA